MDVSETYVEIGHTKCMADLNISFRNMNNYTDNEDYYWFNDHLTGYVQTIVFSLF